VALDGSGDCSSSEQSDGFEPEGQWPDEAGVWGAEDLDPNALHAHMQEEYAGMRVFMCQTYSHCI
jgi:hypothetical protein